MRLPLRPWGMATMRVFFVESGSKKRAAAEAKEEKGKRGREQETA
jgi:hypothetical protein